MSKDRNALKVLVKTPISSWSGYGNDGIGLLQALIRWGADVYVDPQHVAAPLPEDVAQLLTKPVEAPFDLVIDHEDPGLLDLKPVVTQNATVVVGWTMWEFLSLGNLAKDPLRNLPRTYPKFDMILGYDNCSIEALKPHIPEGVVLDKLQGGYDPKQYPYVERDWFSDRFGFFMLGALSSRKNPFTAIQCFQELKRDYPQDFEGAELHLKNSLHNLHPKMEEWVPKLRVHSTTWPPELMKQFMAMQHCMLAPSWGEGKNIPALDFMTSGGAVIGTNFGGHAEWMNKDYCYPIDYTLGSHDKTKPDVKSARIKQNELKDAMMHVYQNRAEAKRKGELASKIIPQMCSWDAVVERLFLKIKDNLGSKGEEVYQRAVMVRQDRQEETLW